MIEQLYFYMTEASPELLEDRREYIERVIVGRLKSGLELMQKWSPEFSSNPEAQTLIATYAEGLKFFIDRGFSTEVA